jgi:hypothetical protein
MRATPLPLILAIALGALVGGPAAARAGWGGTHAAATVSGWGTADTAARGTAGSATRNWLTPVE